MPRLFSSIAEKINASPIGAVLHGSGTTAPSKEQQAYEGAPPQAPANHLASPASSAPNHEQSGTLSGRHHGFESIQHQFRTLQAQYTSGASQESRQLQLMITLQKGVALDFDAVGRDAKGQSMQMYVWGQTQQEDVKDVTDRLAYLNDLHGVLSYTLATEIDKSRQAWKNVRNAEAELAPRRTARLGLKNQIQKFQLEGGRTGGVDGRIAGLEDQLKRAESDDAALEYEVELLKRSAIREAETIKWKALREYGQKLAVIAGASEQLLNILPTSPSQHYDGTQKTAAVRAAVSQALANNNYAAPTEHLPLNTGSVSLDDARSFGETHAHELSSIANISTQHVPPSPNPFGNHNQLHEPPHAIDPTTLNNTPAQIPPTHTTPPVGQAHTPPAGAPPTAYHPPPSQTLYAAPTAPPPSVPNPTVGHTSTVSQSSVPAAPTVAETGIPVTAGSEGPGPAHGSLTAANKEKDEVVDRPVVGYGIGSPNDEHFSPPGEIPPVQIEPPSTTNTLPPTGGGLAASTSTRRPETHHESAEDEKKRLEREERERLLAANSGAPKKNDPDAPPAYE